MSPTAIENRLELVGELTRACLLLRRNIKAKPREKVGNDNMGENLPARNSKLI